MLLAARGVNHAKDKEKAYQNSELTHMNLLSASTADERSSGSVYLLPALEHTATMSGPNAPAIHQRVLPQ